MEEQAQPTTALTEAQRVQMEKISLGRRMQQKPTMAFKSWREESNEVQVRWPAPDMRDSAVRSVQEQFPGISLRPSGRFGVRITCRDASQVFWVKELVRRLDGRVA